MKSYVYSRIAPLAFALSDHPAIKLIAAAAGFCVAYVLPSDGLVAMGGATSVLVALDTVTGLHAAIATGTPVSSAKFRGMVGKIVNYLAFVATASVAGRFVPGLEGNPGPVVAPALMVLMSAEIISIFENLKKTGLKIPKSVADAIKGKPSPPPND